MVRSHFLDFLWGKQLFKKSFKISFKLAILSSLFVVCVHDAATAAGFPDYLSKLMPSVFRDKSIEGPQPEDTLQAPFSTEEKGDMSASDALGLEYQADVSEVEDLSIAHRHAEQIGMWLTDAVTQALNFSAGEYDAHMEALEQMMSSQGMSDFRQFVDSANMVSMMEKRGLQLHSFANGKPLLKNEGELNGRYRWLFQIPVTMTFLPEGLTGYKNKDPDINEKIMVNVQVGRVSGQNEDGLVVETWSARKIRN